MRIEIISIGRELVSGRTRDTNSSYMAERLFGAGIMVRRITLVDDLVKDIAASLREAMGRGSQVLITSGGLGPTPDDVTLRAVSDVAGVRLLSDPVAVNMIKEKYEDLFRQGLVPFAKLSPERMKMAIIPSGATLLENSVGVAPGIKLRVGISTFYCLPGVPGEMKGMFENTVYPDIALLFEGGAVVVKKIRSRFGDESLISEIVEIVEKKFPSIYIKPKPVGFEKRERITVEFIASEGERADISQIEKAMRYFQELEEDRWKRR